MRVLATKIKQAVHKRIAKNKASKQLHISCQKTKKKALKQTSNSARLICHMVQNAQAKQAQQNRNTHSAIKKAKQNRNGTGQKPKAKY